MNFKHFLITLFLFSFLFAGNIQICGGNMISEDSNLAIIKQRQATIDQLINNFKISKDREYKISILYTLGELRAEVAVPLLIENLTYGIDDSTKRLPKYPNPAAKALEKIGIPSIQPVLEFIKSNTNDFKLALACDTLVGIDGYDLAVFFLKKEISKTRDSQHLDNLNKAVKIISKQKL